MKELYIAWEMCPWIDEKDVVGVFSDKEMARSWREEKPWVRTLTTVKQLDKTFSQLATTYNQPYEG